ncbi:Tigger transposable element-derived protein 6 [Rhizoctonia solani AG-1 IB]|uniref:Tigger transposable element-derived protein 6 n=1 Tax=Thanatephorus cucumeris (strain AG1-IB / isolate 7/3/14) TaxID=1108050 RepID=M5BZR1_THACB|nr:Tigger transposable element-derived protein 6 [Rhizoctonia solani AG-1 IB]
MAPSSSPFLFNNTPFQVYRPPGQGSAVRRRQKESQLRSQTNTHAPYSLRQNLTMHDKLKILDYCGGDSTKDLTQQEKVVQLHSMGYYTLSQSTLSTLLRDEDLLRAYADAHPEHLHMKRRPIVQLPHVEAALHEWILQKQDRGIRLTGDLIREKARDFCRLFNIPEQETLKFSNGWLDRLKKRFGLVAYKFHGEAASAPTERLATEVPRILELFTGYDPCDIFNADETALFFRVKLNKSRLTYLLCANMDGSEKRQPLIIGRARRPRCFGNLEASQLGFYYFWNQTAWMYQSIWETYLNDFNEDMKAQDRHILLLVDNAPTHRHNAANYSNIQVEFLPPNLTSWIQPMDAGIIQCFKSHYRNRFTRLALDRDDSGFENIYGINQLDAMSIASNAWAAVSPSTISNCWRHTGLITSPPSPNDDYSSREEQSLVEEMARHPRFMQPTFQRLWTVMGGQTQTEHEETDEEISRRIEVGLTLGE